VDARVEALQELSEFYNDKPALNAATVARSRMKEDLPRYG